MWFKGWRMALIVLGTVFLAYGVIFAKLWPVFSSDQAALQEATSPAPLSGATLGSNFILPLHGQASITGGPTVTLLGVSSDSRCPKGVTCIWAGEATVLLGIRVGNLTATTTLSTRDASTMHRESAGYVFTLVNLTPHRANEPNLYAATLRVGKNK